MQLVSLVVPCYNEEKTIPLFYAEAAKVIDKIQQNRSVNFEIIFIDDGSKDKSLNEMKILAEHDERVRFVSFSRNFGKEAGIYAGLQYAKGDFVATMDVDLQDPPALLEDMIGILLESDEYDCVATRRSGRKGEPSLRSWFSKKFYSLINRMSKTPVVDGARDFRLMRREMVDSVLELSEYNRFSKGLFSWVGYNIKWIEFENIERAVGKTKWNFWSLFKYAVDGIVGFSTAPLLLSVCVGILFCCAALVGIIIVIARALIFGDPTSGWPSLVCIILLCSGVQLFCTGIVGEYLSKVYMEVKKRPIYIVKETEKGRGKNCD